MWVGLGSSRLWGPELDSEDQKVADEEEEPWAGPDLQWVGLGVELDN